MSTSDKLKEVPAGTPTLRIAFKGAKKALSVRPVLTLAGNLAWGVIKPGSDKLPSSYGLNIDPLADSLPDQAAIYNPETGDKVIVAMVAGEAKTRDGKEKNPSTVYSGTHVVPGTTEERVFDIRVSVSQKTGLWNVKASLRNAGGGSTSSPVEVEFAEDDLDESIFA